MKVAAGWDHRGRKFRETVERVVRELGHEFADMGAQTDISSDYPDFAVQVGESVGRGEFDRGVLICGTGIGMSIAANKVAGVRAAAVHDEESARLSRAHNDSNVLCIGQAIAETPALEKIVKVWLNTKHDGGRHARRVNKIMEYERRKLGRAT